MFFFSSKGELRGQVIGTRFFFRGVEAAVIRLADVSPVAQANTAAWCYFSVDRETGRELTSSVQLSGFFSFLFNFRSMFDLRSSSFKHTSSATV